MPERILIYRVGDYGLGHVLTSIVNCAHYAYTRGYSLGLDFSGFVYLSRDRHERAFENFAFNFPVSLNVIRDLSKINALTNSSEKAEVNVNITKEQFKQGVASDIILINGDLIDSIFTTELKQAVQYYIDPRGELLALLSARLRQTAWTGETIGLYFRHGNGEFLDMRFDPNMFPNHEVFYAKVKDAYVDRAQMIAARQQYTKPRFFIASDSADFTHEMKQRLPNAFSIAEFVSNVSWHRALGAASSDLAGLSDALNDLYFLSFCDYLIYSPSLFPTFAILNSRKLDLKNTEVMAIPNLSNLIEQSTPDEAVIYAKAAVRKLFLMNREAHVPQALTALARAFERQGNPEAAQSTLRRREHLNLALKDNDYRLAEKALLSVGDVTLAQGLKAARAAADRASKNPFTIGRLSELLERCGDIESALSMARAACELDGEKPGILVLLSRLLEQVNQFSESTKIAQAALEFDRDDEVTQRQFINVAWLAETTFVNVSRGKKAIQSSLSRWSKPNDACGAVTGIRTGKFGFHTDFEAAPWWEVDLGGNEHVIAIRAFNRDDGYAAHAVKSLTIALSIEREGPWTQVYGGGAVFGGIHTGEPLKIIFEKPIEARYVKFQLHKHAALHLDQIDVFALLENR